MGELFDNVVLPKTKVTVLSKYNLISDCLRVLLESDREIRVLDVVGTSSELIKKAGQNKSDVVLICLTDKDSKNINFISDIFQALPLVKIVILANPDSMLDQPQALKLGVTGIVATNQNSRTLIRAIRQVSEGEVWLNQKLIAQLLGGDFHTKNGKSKTNGFAQTNELTNREREVVKMVGLGMNNREISKNLNISEATVRHHLSSIYSKLYIEDRLNLAIFAYQQGIVQPPPKSA